MVSSSAPSANEPAKDLSVAYTVQLKPMIKAHSSGIMVSSGISDVLLRENPREKVDYDTYYYYE